MPAAEQTAVLDEAQLSAKRIFGSIATELMLVEAEFARQARSNIHVIAYIGDYLRRSGGKRVRPALTSLADHAVGGDGGTQSSSGMSSMNEFLHKATLARADVVDKGETSRLHPSTNS